jgi:hypothetical protein
LHPGAGSLFEIAYEPSSGEARMDGYGYPAEEQQLSQIELEDDAAAALW